MFLREQMFYIHLFIKNCFTCWHLIVYFFTFQHDSVFDMRRPYDLLAFLEQEKRQETANAIYKKITRKEVSIDNQFLGLGMADVESSNSECFLSEKSLTDVDVHASIVVDYRFRDGVK